MRLMEDLFKMDQTQSLFGNRILQSHASILVYEKLLNEHRSQLQYICEIGTATGMLTTYFSLWGFFYGREVLTIDNGASDWAWKASDKTLELLAFLGTTVYRGDCFSQHYREVIKQFTKYRTGLLFCDGGNKERELKTFSEFVTKESIIICHDWEYEVKSEDIPETLEPYEPWHTQSIGLGTKAAILRKKDV